MSDRSSHRLTAKPVSLSAESWASQRPRRPLTFLPLVMTFARYVRSNSSHAPARSLPHVIRITMVVPPWRRSGSDPNPPSRARRRQGSLGTVKYLLKIDLLCFDRQLGVQPV